MNVALLSLFDNIGYGIRILSSCLKRKGITPKIIFFKKFHKERYSQEELNELLEICKDDDLIGISLMTNYFDNAVQITKFLKANTDALVIWGGVHPTLKPRECLEWADMVCIGEGEEVLPLLVEKLSSSMNHFNIPGILFKHKNNIYGSESPAVVNNLNTIPYPDYDCDNKYVLMNKRILKFSKILHPILFPEREGKYKITYCMISRGCPYVCTFCYASTTHYKDLAGKPIRTREVENVIGELIMIKEKLPFVEMIRFTDYVFPAYHINELKKFCDKYKMLINLPFATNLTPTMLSEEKLKILLESGLRWLRIGIESGTERILKMYKRYYTRKKILDVCKVLNKYRDRLTVNYDLIVDNPYETEEELIDSLIFLTQIPTPYNLSIFSMTFYPGTELYQKAKIDGIIKDELNEVYRKETIEMKPSYINKLYVLMGKFARLNVKIPAMWMKVLTNKLLRKLKLHWILYYFTIMIYIFLRVYYGLLAFWEKGGIEGREKVAKHYIHRLKEAFLSLEKE